MSRTPDTVFEDLVQNTFGSLAGRLYSQDIGVIKRHIQGALFVISGLIALGTILNLATLDIPVYFGLVHGGYSSSKRPGRLQCVLVSPPELYVMVLVSVSSIFLAVWSWICLWWTQRPNEIDN